MFLAAKGQFRGKGKTTDADAFSQEAFTRRRDICQNDPPHPESTSIGNADDLGQIFARSVIPAVCLGIAANHLLGCEKPKERRHVTAVETGPGCRRELHLACTTLEDWSRGKFEYFL